MWFFCRRDACIAFDPQSKAEATQASRLQKIEFSLPNKPENWVKILTFCLFFIHLRGVLVQ
jgi:hypothetical protein